MTRDTDSTKAPIVYQGVVIRERYETLSLTDMWKAAKEPQHREPYQWARKEGASFIEAVALAHNLPVEQVMKSKPGKGGGTYAHWQIGLAYAKYLSPEFHMWCNTVVRERMEGKHGPDPLTAREHGGITKAVIGKAVAELEMRLQAHLDEVVTSRVTKLMESYDPTGGFTTDYAPIRRFIDEAVPNPRGRGALTRRAAFRCRKWLIARGQGAMMRVSRETDRLLFHVKAAEEWMVAEGLMLARQHQDRMAGQTIMRLVPRKKPSGGEGA